MNPCHCTSHHDSPANGQAVIFLTGFLEVFVYIYFCNLDFGNSIGQLCPLSSQQSRIYDHSKRINDHSGKINDHSGRIYDNYVRIYDHWGRMAFWESWQNKIHLSAPDYSTNTPETHLRFVFQLFAANATSDE